MTQDSGDVAPPGDVVGPEEALEFAVRAHRSGDIAVAEMLYGRILEASPDYADALHLYGVLKHQTGRPREAVTLVRRAIELDPDEPGMHSNLGNIFIELDRPDLAVQAFEAAIGLDPQSTDARNNLGVALRTLRRTDEAEEVYRAAVAIDPDRGDTWDNLGRLLGSGGRVEEAIEAHCKALELAPRNADTRRLLVSAYAATDDSRRALKILRRWLEDEPANPSAQHLMAAISGENVPERASDRYVEGVFDGFAESFDHKLARLDYRAPEVVGATATRACGPSASALDVLDAGCGTGLCGAYLRPLARRLVGVDLSGKMLAKAEARGQYDALERAELTAYLAGHSGAFDLVVSADTLCYFGRLDPVFAAALTCLRPGGSLIFTLEENVPGTDTRLNPHGRYSHGADYVSSALAAAGFVDVALARTDLRLERGKPVAGLVVTASR